MKEELFLKRLDQWIRRDFRTLKNCADCLNPDREEAELQAKEISDALIAAKKLNSKGEQRKAIDSAIKKMQESDVVVDLNNEGYAYTIKNFIYPSHLSEGLRGRVRLPKRVLAHYGYRVERTREYLKDG